MADLSNSLQVSASGMYAQAMRIRIISENLANQNTVGSSPGADAYRRQSVQFRNEVNRASGAETVSAHATTVDSDKQKLRYDPGNPAANSDGYVKTPNVNSFVEIMDMRDAEHAYSANLSAATTTREMLIRTLDLLK